MVIFKNKVNICVSVAIFGVTFFTGFTQAQNFDDTRENGPFDQRYFGRIKGIPPAVSLAPQPSVVEPSVKLIEDADGTTNELIVFLQYEKMPDLVKLMGAAGKNNSAAVVAAPELERAVIESLNNKSNKNLNDLMRSPAHARFLIEMERMTDEERLRSARSRPDRERLERFMVLRYPSVALARSAAETLSKEPTVASAKLNRVVVQSMVPNDPYFAKVGSAMPKPHYQWGAYAMNFPAAWDQARGQAQIGILDTAYFGMISYVPSTANSAAKYVVDPHPDLALNARLHFTPGAPSTVGAHDVHLHAVHVAGIIGAQSNNLNSNETLPNGKVFKGGTSGGCIGWALLHKSKKVDMTPTPDAATPQQAPPPLWGTQVA